MKSHECVALVKNVTDINCWNVIKMAGDYSKYRFKFPEMLSEL